MRLDRSVRVGRRWAECVLCQEWFGCWLRATCQGHSTSHTQMGAEAVRRDCCGDCETDAYTGDRRHETALLACMAAMLLWLIDVGKCFYAFMFCGMVRSCDHNVVLMHRSVTAFFFPWLRCKALDWRELADYARIGKHAGRGATLKREHEGCQSGLGGSSREHWNAAGRQRQCARQRRRLCCCCCGCIQASSHPRSSSERGRTQHGDAQQGLSAHDWRDGQGGKGN